MPNQQQIQERGTRIYILVCAIILAVAHVVVNFAWGYSAPHLVSHTIFWCVDVATLCTFGYFSIHDIANKGNADNIAIAAIFISTVGSLAWLFGNFHG